MKYNYHAIALEKFNIGEADRLYTFYTLEEGLIRVPAKSIRKNNAKLASQVEDFVFTHITVAKTYGRGILTGAVVENYFVELHESFYAIKCVDNVRLLFLSMIDEGIRDDKIFTLFIQYLTQINKISKTQNEHNLKFDWVTQAFLIQLFTLLGYDFCISKCNVCKNKIHAVQNRFSSGRGGIVCRQCSDDKYLCYINSNTLKAMRIIQNNKLEFILKVNIDNDVQKQLNKIIVNIKKWIMR